MNWKEYLEARKSAYTGELVGEWLRIAYDSGVKDFIARGFPDIEIVAAYVHEAWMESKRAQGVSSRMSEDGEELMVDYDQLSEKAKDLDRNTVKAVYKAIGKALADN